MFSYAKLINKGKKTKRVYIFCYKQKVYQSGVEILVIACYSVIYGKMVGKKIQHRIFTFFKIQVFKNLIRSSMVSSRPAASSSSLHDDAQTDV